MALWKVQVAHALQEKIKLAVTLLQYYRKQVIFLKFWLAANATVYLAQMYEHIKYKHIKNTKAQSIWRPLDLSHQENIPLLQNRTEEERQRK